MVQKTEERRLRNVQRVLEEELARLRRMIPFEESLTVCWRPRSHSEVSGEVVGDTVYVYDENGQEAMNTLKHEYLDCLLTRKMVEPLIAMVNTFIKLKEREIYEEKERIVTNLLKLI